MTKLHIQLLLLQIIHNKYQHKLILEYFYINFFSPAQIFLLKQRSVKEVVDLICWVDLFQNFRFKFDIAWLALWSLAQKEVLNLFQTYIVVFTIATHNSSTEVIF